MRRRAFISGLLATCSILCANIRSSAAWELVTREEIKRESAAPHNKTAHVSPTWCTNNNGRRTQSEATDNAAYNDSYCVQGTGWCYH
jgi:hypothetical protein